MKTIKTKDYNGSMDTNNVADLRFKMLINGYVVYAENKNSDEFLVCQEDSEFILAETDLDEVTQYLVNN
jgi:hypothetical protein